MAKLHHILIPSALGLVVGALSAAFAIHLYQAPEEPVPPIEARNAALAQRICNLEDEVFTLGSLVDRYQGIFRIPFLEESREPDIQDALGVLPLHLGTFMRLANPTE